MKHNKPSLLDWLAVKELPDFSKSKPLGALVGVLLALFLLLLVVMVVSGTFNIAAGSFGFGRYADDATGAATRNVGLVIAAVIGFPFVVWRSTMIHKSNAIAEQSQITDRINKAVQGLGSEKTVKRILEKPKYKKQENGEWLLEEGKPVAAKRPDGTPIVDREQLEETKPNIEVRLGSILSLEPIARDSSRDTEHIMGILAAYIRESSREVGDLRSFVPIAKPSEDIQAAVSVIAKRDSFHPPSYGEISDFRPSFASSNLNGVYGRTGNFSGAILDWSSWQNADLGFSNFQGARAQNTSNFFGADLDSSIFDGATLVDLRFSVNTIVGGCSFKDATLESINFLGLDVGTCSFERASVTDCNFNDCTLLDANFRNARINGCTFVRASLFVADFSGAKGWEQSQFDQAFGVRGDSFQTLLPEGASYPPHWIDLSDLDDEYDELATFEYEYEEWLERLEKAGF